jgi:acetyl coenzyme A synthetase (ADP forming)-like protein
MALAPLDSYAHDAVVKDGRTVHIRPIRTDDLDALMDMWHRLSKESIRLRFFAPRKMNREQMRYFTELDWRTRFAVVAEQAGAIIGVSRFDVLPEEGSNAEFAVLVEDTHQGRGIGTALVRALMEPAADMGVTGFVADVLRENNRMLGVMRDAGLAPAIDDYGSVVHARFTTTPTETYLSTFDEQDRLAAVAAMNAVFRPASIAVVGASRDRATIGGLAFSHLIAGGYSGPVYPVNNSAGHVQAVAAYASLSDCPTVPEMILVCVPAPVVHEVIREAGQLGVSAAVVVSAGFAETGGDGALRERRLMSLARSYGMRLVGPNCMGVLNAAADVRMNATFSAVFPEPGRVGFSSQSGALGLAILAAARRLGIGLSSFVSVGNKADISGNDLLQYWENDPDTDVILLYLESFGNPRKFGRLARRIGRSKPIAAVKSGRTTAGTRAASSHTAALAAGDIAVEALFRQAGVIRTDTLEELFDVTTVLANQPLPPGRRVAILTNGGGPGILAADACESNGLEVAELSETTRLRLAELLPGEAAVRNPVDMIASATPEAYGQALRVLAEDPCVDALLVIFVPPVVTSTEDVAEAVADAAADIAADEVEGASVPVLSVFMAEQGVPDLLRDARIPSFDFPEDAAKALGRVARYADWRRTPLGNVVEASNVDENTARKVIEEALGAATRRNAGGGDAGGTAEGEVPGTEVTTWLTAEQAHRLLGAYGVTTASSEVVATADEAAEAQARLATPTAVKVAAAVHKTELGGVRLGIASPEAAREAVESIIAALAEAGEAQAAESGFLVQEMIGDGVEMVVGVSYEPSFGPIMLVGLGGTMVELVSDVSVRIHPLTDSDVEEMLTSLKGYPLLTGYRGSEPVDVEALKGLLFRLSAMVEAFGEIDQIDMNPVFVCRKGASCVDVRIRVARHVRQRR